MPTTDQKKLLEMLDRRHPDYDRMKTQWDFLELCYEGGRDWFSRYIFRYLKEGDREYEDRVKRAYRFNHTRAVVNLVTEYIFRSRIERNRDDAEESLTRFWDNATLGGLDIGQFMSLVSNKASIYGVVWVFVDTNRPREVRSIRDERESGARTYAYLVKPQNIVDVGFADDGSINWVIVREFWRRDDNPVDAESVERERYRVWMRDRWYLYEIEDGDHANRKAVLVEQGPNSIGVIPGFPVFHLVGEYRYVAPGLVDDIAYLDRAVANYLSNLDAIIQDQTFSQLAIPAQGLSPGDDKDSYNQIVDMGTKRIFVYNGEGGVRPEFLSPDPKQANVILGVINKIINEIYHSVGLAGERTKEDNALGIDNSSGVAKAYDFERVNALLVNKAHSLKNAENRLVQLVRLWNGSANTDELVQYPETFDVRSLYDEFAIAEKLSLVMAPPAVRREQMKQIIDKLFPSLKKDLIRTLKSETDDWLDDEAVELPAPPASGGAPNAGRENRQGQVTADTE